MRLYRRWRQLKQQVVRPETSEATRGPPIDIPHLYLAINKVEGPPLPRRNRAVLNIYPPLPAKSSLLYSNDLQTLYADQGPRMAIAGPPREALYTAQVQRAAERAAPRRTSFLHDPQFGNDAPCSECSDLPGRPVGRRQPRWVTATSPHRHPEVSRQHLPEGPHQGGDETRPLNRVEH